MKLRQINSRSFLPVLRLCAALLVAACLWGQAAPGQAQSLAEQQAIEARFVRGLTLLDGGRPDAAIAIFSAILAEDPGLVRVRLELARAYFAAGRWQEARREFFLVLSGDIPDPVRQTVLGFVRAIDARRGFDWDLSLALTRAGDGRSYASDVLFADLGPGPPVPFVLNRRGSGGIGLAYDISAEIRAAVPGLSGRASRVTGFGEVFAFGIEAPGRRFDDRTLGLRTGLRLAAARRTAFAGLAYDTTREGGATVERELRLELAADRRDRRGRSVFGRLEAGVTEDPSLTRSDTRFLRGTLGVGRTFGGNRSVDLRLFGEIVDAERDVEDSREIGLRIGGAADLPFGIRLAPSAFVSRKHFPDPNPVFVDSPDERSFGVSLRVEKTDWFIGPGARPFAEIGYLRTDSDAAAFSHDELVYRLGFERRF
ncbi:tetratricopeptide repeat protein [Ovoidimarina sediminis]|uniref:tetratricopeptide repeat protein n=1 Tax=Ovoidimarina sediminis TaxID=3079856 RepID=UPI00290F3633|nr:tetratricopeptide repeat protein [Rhodophyticola sp. MJ-SS7]MDU8942820.1 tetratricopeptide repeat protein [Rhodophyticola sp. MJ-SS7]